jgi:predicted deacylase
MDVHRGRLFVGEMPGGGPIELPYTEFRGAEPGPTVWVIAARDGDEVHATMAALELQRSLHAAELRGTVIVMPVVNVPGFEVLSRSHPLAPSYLGAQLEARVFEVITSRGGLLVDLHSAGTVSDTVDWTLHFEDDMAAAGMARAFGAPYAYAHRMGTGSGPNAGLLDGALFVRASAAGVPAFLVEAGGGLPPDDSITLRTVARLENVLRHVGVLSGDVEPTPEPRVLHGFRIVTPSRGGIMESLVALGDEVGADQVLAVVRDLQDQQVEEIRSPVAGVVLTVGLNPAVGTGTWAFEVGW